MLSCPCDGGMEGFRDGGREGWVWGKYTVNCQNIANIDEHLTYGYSVV